MENIPEQFNIEPERKSNYKPSREEEKLIKQIDAQRKLEEIIEFPEEKAKEKNLQDLIWAAQQEVERLGGIDMKKAEELQNLIETAGMKSHKEKFKNIKTWKTFK